MEFPHLIRVYKDGSVDRLWSFPPVPPTPQDPETGVASKDVIISDQTGVSARLYLPNLTSTFPTQKLPIVVYFHKGGFCLDSAFSPFEHRYMNLLALQSHALVISVEYRLAPEHPLPAAYEDGWAALQWLSAQPGPDPWLAHHGDLDSLFVGGDSAGANIAHNLAMRSGTESLPNGVKIKGAYLCHSYFLGPKRAGPRKPEHDMGFHQELAFDMWKFGYPDAVGGPGNPMVDPMGPGAPSLAGLGCPKVLVVVAGKDDIKEWSVLYYNAVKDSGFGGTVQLFEVEDEGHAFQILNPDCDNAKLLFQQLASFFKM